MLSAPSVLQDWYQQHQTAHKLSPDPAGRSFDDAVEFFKQKLTKEECKRIWIEDKNSMSDVQAAVDKARRAYESSMTSSARKWLEKFSLRLLFYGGVLDILVQHHPEYVSLAWGAMKFLFSAFMNQAELIAQLSKALSKIAEALPRIELKNLLYPTQRMRDTVAVVYALIIKFVVRTVDWYTEGRAKHILHSITRPYAIRFKDIVDDVREACQNVDELATTASQAELRDMHILLRKLESFMLDTQKINAENYRVNQETFRRVCEIQFSQLLDAATSASAGFLSPQARLRLCQAMRNRRRRLQSRQGAMVKTNIATQLSKLGAWSSSQKSSLIIARASFANRDQAKDFATDIIDIAHSSNKPVVWALRGLEPTSDPTQLAEPQSLTLIKQLVMQVLQLNEKLLDYPTQGMKMTASRFQSATTEAEWFDIFASVLETTPQMYVVVDTEALRIDPTVKSTWPAAFQQLFDKLDTRGISTVLKVLLVSYRGTIASPPDSGVGSSSNPPLILHLDRGRTAVETHRSNMKAARGKPAGLTRRHRASISF